MAPEREASIRAGMLRAQSQVGDSEYWIKTDAALAALDVEKILLRFPWNSSAMRAKAEAIRNCFSGEAQAVAATCENVLAHRFDLLGSGLIRFGATINWHKDYLVSHEWPAGVDFTRMGVAAFDILIDRESRSELKFPWDLSNLHWIPSLASSFYLNGDPRCLEAFAGDWTSWMAANPPFAGVNWFCPMNIAIRQINVMAGLAAFHPFLSGALARNTVQSLFRHGLFTMAHLELESHARRNNHYLTDLCGLYFAGIFFQDTDEGRGWLEFATRELESECEYHFYADGVIFEDSTSYHRLSLEMLLLCAILARTNGRSFSATFHERLERAATFTVDLMQLNHTIPQFGDNDNGRILQFTGYATVPVTDHRHILAVAGGFFDNEAMRACAGDAGADAIWMLGGFNPVPPTAARTRFAEYQEGGYYIFKTDNLDLIIRNGRISPYCGGGHAHSDQLSFTLNWNGEDIFVDPGSYRYSSDFQARNAFRSVEYHNTIQIDDLPMHDYDRNSFAGLWSMRDLADAETDSAGFQNGVFGFSGRIHSYETAGVTVARKIEYAVETNCLSVCDSAVASAAPASAVSRLLLAPGVSAAANGSGKISLRKNGAVLAEIHLPSAQSDYRVNSLWFSPSYGKRVPALQLEFRWDAGTGFNLNIFLKHLR